MRLDRNTNGNGKGKYALIKLREIPGNPSTPEELAAAILANPACVDWGERHSDGEFFLIRLKDRFAPPALHAYSKAAAEGGLDQFSLDVYAMALRAENHPGKKTPD